MNYSAEELPQCIAIALPTMQMDKASRDAWSRFRADEKWSSVVMGRCKPLFSVFTIFSVLLVTGCASSPTRELGSVAPTSNPIASVANLGKQAKTWSTGLVDSLQSQLKTGSSDVRAGAARQLGQYAKNDERGSFRAIEMLTQALQRDDDMSVRVAATDALAGIHDGNSSRQLDGLVPIDRLAHSDGLDRVSPFGSNDDASAPQMSFLGGLFRR